VDWLTGMDISDPVTSSMVWAKDSNAYVCTTVMPNGVLATENVDLSGAYYTSALPVVQLQIAKAGYRSVTENGQMAAKTDKHRLAAWLNLIATGSTGL
jgi:hypothetical protein